MQVSIGIRSRLSDDAVALIHAWTVAQGAVDEELVDVVARFATVLERSLQHRTSEAALKVRPVGTRWLIVIDFPPFMELAMREVMDAITSPGRTERRRTRIWEMTRVLQGGHVQ